MAAVNHGNLWCCYNIMYSFGSYFTELTRLNFPCWLMMSIFFESVPHWEAFISQQEERGSLLVCSCCHVLYGFWWAAIAPAKGRFPRVLVPGAATQACGSWLGCSCSALLLGAFTSLTLRVFLQCLGSDWAEAEDRGWRARVLGSCVIAACRVQSYLVQLKMSGCDSLSLSIYFSRKAFELKQAFKIPSFYLFLSCYLCW